jgi:hypothetical protein
MEFHSVIYVRFVFSLFSYIIQQSHKQGCILNKNKVEKLGKTQEGNLLTQIISLLCSFPFGMNCLAKGSSFLGMEPSSVQATFPNVR